MKIEGKADFRLYRDATVQSKKEYETRNWIALALEAKANVGKCNLFAVDGSTKKQWSSFSLSTVFIKSFKRVAYP